MAKDPIKCEIKKLYGVLSESANGSKKIYANISWNGREAKDEIRSTWTNNDGEEVVGKGIALTDDEVEKLIEYHEAKKGPKPVNFDDIFADAPSILDRREQGHVTKDGAIVLQEDGELARRAKAFRNK